MSMDKKSIAEKVSSGLVPGLIATGIGTVTGNPLAAFLPILTATPAAIRHEARLKKAFEEINEMLLQHEEKLKSLHDNEYAFVGELVNTVLRTTNEEKIGFLKLSIKNGIVDGKLNNERTTQVTRAIRDINASEANFLLKNIKYKIINVDFESKQKDDNSLTIASQSPEYELLGGLITLGLVPFTSKYADVDVYYFSDVAFDVVNLLKSD